MYFTREEQSQMSAARESFHASILAKRYSEAVITLNSLHMAEMLPALAAIEKKHREELGKALMLAVGKVCVARIQYALSVVYLGAGLQNQIYRMDSDDQVRQASSSACEATKTPETWLVNNQAAHQGKEKHVLVGGAIKCKRVSVSCQRP
jgi:hypothetical protein